MAKSERIMISYDPETHGKLKEELDKLSSLEGAVYSDRSRSEIGRLVLKKGLDIIKKELGIRVQGKEKGKT